MTARIIRLLFAVLLTAVPALATADLLDDIKARGTLVVGVKDATPPFGFISPESRSVVGYDVDFAEAIARELGVELRLVPVTTATRVPELTQGKIDLIIATMTHTKQRERQIDFSHTYFMTGQKLLVHRDSGIRSVADLRGKRVSSVRGSTSEQNIRRAVPGVRVVSFNDYPNAFLALAQRKVAAMTTDEIILMNFHQRAPDPEMFDLPDEYISTEPYGIGVRKGQPALLDAVNRILEQMEASGEAARIHAKWFGPDTDTPLKRSFKIGPANL